VIMAPRLVFGSRLRFIPLRLFMYISVANVLYLVDILHVELTVFSSPVQAVYFVIMAIACLFAISKDKEFVVSTTDLLVLLMVGVIVFLPEILSIEADIESALLKLIVLFYACELVVSSMQSRWNISVSASLFAFVVIAFRGLV